MEFTRDDLSTRQRVARSILVNGPSTAATLAEQLDLTPAAVRRHLDQLVEEGAVEPRDPMFALRAFADQRVSFIEARFEATREAHPDLTPAQVLARVFTDEGYAAGVRELPVVNGQSAGEQLCQQHCPVSHVAHEFPQLCEAETQAISRVLGRHVQRLATIAHGDGVCTTCIPDLPTTSTTSSTEKERVTS